MIDANQTFVAHDRSRSNIGQAIGTYNMISPVNATNGFNLFNTTVGSNNGSNTMKNA